MHWSPNNGFSLAHEIRGWNECLLSYVLAASSPSYAIDASVYHKAGRKAGFPEWRSYYDIELPLGRHMAAISASATIHSAVSILGADGCLCRLLAQTTHHVAIIWRIVSESGSTKTMDCLLGLRRATIQGYRLHLRIATMRHYALCGLVQFSLCPEASSRALRYFYECRARLWVAMFHRRLQLARQLVCKELSGD